MYIMQLLRSPCETAGNRREVVCASSSIVFTPAVLRSARLGQLASEPHPRIEPGLDCVSRRINHYTTEVHKIRLPPYWPPVKRYGTKGQRAMRAAELSVVQHQHQSQEVGYHPVVHGTPRPKLILHPITARRTGRSRLHVLS